MIFSKKKHYINAASSVGGILGPMCGRKPIEDKLGNINTKPLGYVFGFTDAALRVRRLRVNTRYGEAVLRSILETLWPNNGDRYAITLMSLAKNSDLIDASGYGRNDYVNVLNNDSIPFGLSLSILANENADCARKYNEEIRKLRQRERAFVVQVKRSGYATHEAHVTAKIASLAETVASGQPIRSGQ